MAAPKYLFVASTGGHLAQLLRFSNTFEHSPESLWITFDTAQSRSILQGKRVEYVPYVASRDVKGVVGAARIAKRLLSSESFDLVVSTGAGLALAVLPQARLRGIPTRYIESVSRLDGPSMTGKILALTRSADLYTQHPSWSSSAWKSHPSVLASFERVPRTKPQTRKLFVTLGTIKKYRFDRLVDAVAKSGAEEGTTWQLGQTHRNDLRGDVNLDMSADSFTLAAAQADVVITHAGVGTILQLLEMGIYPIVVPRSRSYLEHVDDHQWQIARLCKELQIAEVVAPDNLNVDTIEYASGFSVKAVTNDRN